MRMTIQELSSYSLNHDKSRLQPGLPVARGLSTKTMFRLDPDFKLD